MTKEKAKNIKSAQFFYKKKMPENVDNSPFLGQFTLEQFVSKIWVLKFRAIPTQNRRPYIKFFKVFFCEMTEKKLKI